MNDDDPDATMKLPDPGTPLSAGELLARALRTPGPSVGDGRWTPPAPEELARLLPQYQIESLLGYGGMGAVYKGRQAALDRPVAIKLLPAEMAADAQFIARFQREARTLAKLQHPGIVAVHDFGQTSEGHLYFVMEFVDGTDLHRILLAPEGLNPAQALELISQICDALHYAHGKGVIHRDIKPGNILVTTDSRAKLADFGLARPIKDESAMLTGTNVIMGTAAYMAPEQQEGRSDQRADIYALGVMLYEMLCGQRPSGAFDPPSHRVQVDVRLDDVVIKAMQQQPERRYQQVSEMKTDVDRIRTTPQQRKPAPKPKSKSPVAAIIAVCLAAMSAVGFFIWEKWNASRAPRAQAKSADTAKVERAAPSRVSPGADDASARGATRSTATATKDVQGRVINLLPLVDVKRDAIKGKWSVKPEGLTVDTPADWSVCELPYEPPEEYDFEVEFTPTANGLNPNLYLNAGGASFAWKVNSHGRTPPLYGFDQLDGKQMPMRTEAVATNPLRIETGQRYTTRVEVRRDGLRGFVNGMEMLHWSGDFKRFSMEAGSALRNARALGVGSWKRAVIFHRIEVREVSDPGHLTAQAAPALPSPPGTATKDVPGSIATFAGHRYQFVAGAIPWNEAKAKAEAMGGHLAVISTSEEDAWVRSLLSAVLKHRGDCCWIGAQCESKGKPWQWADGSPFDFTAWTVGQPNYIGHGDSNEPYYLGYVFMDGPLGWNDVGASEKSAKEGNLGFLVEWDSVGQTKAGTPAAPPAIAGSPASATKNAPFVNTLGLKFVPVPITGGPTSGQRVLFSIWETRVQDYAPYAKSTNADGTWKEPGFPQGDTHPVVSVKYDEARGFCTWLTERERKAGKLGANEEYRLPSDHEWSCAVGIGDKEDPAKLPEQKHKKITDVFPWGRVWPPEASSGNYWSEELRPLLSARSFDFITGELPGYRDGFAMTSPVGSFAADRFGLYDIGGNVREWCEDWWDKEQKEGVIRGASWGGHDRDHLLSSFRSHRPRGDRNSNCGFRVVLAPVAP